MLTKYDNWERLVGAVVKREQLRQIALSHSMDSSSSSLESSSRFDHSLLQSFIPDGDEIDNSSIMRSVRGVIFLSVEARELVIQTDESSKGQHPYSFTCSDAIEIKPGFLFDIQGKIKTHLLTSKTIYGAYLVFNLLGDEFFGYESTKAMIRYGEDDRDDAERRAKLVRVPPFERRCGWMEMKIGSFYVDEGDDTEVEARLIETSYDRKTGLIVDGIEFRPLVSVKLN